MHKNVHYQLNEFQPPKTGRSKKTLIIGLIVILLIALIVVGVFWFFFRKDSKPQPTAQQAEVQQPIAANQAPEEQSVTLPDLQPTVDAWVKNHSGTYSIAIMNTDGELVASSNHNKEMFMASIYKLFVAYVGYQKIADGSYKANEPYLPGYTRVQCLDAMIRSSNSPCAEKMWNELGKEAITEKVKTYGITNTSLVGLSSTAEDSAKLLQLLYAGKDLTPQHRTAFLDSLKTQDAKYRRGLPAGFTSADVYNKVGWQETTIWHDASIIQTTDGKTLIVAVFTQNAGYNNVAGFGASLEKSLQ